jgi:electron transfer flavoprotein alpha subunit
MSRAVVLVTHVDGIADGVSLQALTFARGLAAGGAVDAVTIGPGGLADGVAIGAGGATTVHVATHPALRAHAPYAAARIVADLAERLDADVIVGPGTELGNDVIARVAARIGEPFAANCTAAAIGSEVCVTRLRWGGSLLEEARLHPGRRTVLTVAPHAVVAEDSGARAQVVPLVPELDDADLLVQVIDRVATPSAGISLADARVVVSGGRGVGSLEGFAPLEDLAGLLGAAVGCSRAATIAGWRPHTDQVGQTGTRIAPDLYIACGLSGATQHMSGCKGAKNILAINIDAEAPIMSSADYVVVGDLRDVVPAVAAEIRRVRQAGAGTSGADAPGLDA